VPHLQYKVLKKKLTGNLEKKILRIKVTFSGYTFVNHDI